MNVRRVYESTVIINAALEDNDIDVIINKITNYIENHGGAILEIDKWGRKRLAYPINKKYNGFYVHIVFETLPINLPILERFYVLEDTILRHLTLILPESLRQHRKEKALSNGKESGVDLISGTDTIVKTEATLTIEKHEIVAEEV